MLCGLSDKGKCKQVFSKEEVSDECEISDNKNQKRCKRKSISYSLNSNKSSFFSFNFNKSVISIYIIINQKVNKNQIYFLLLLFQLIHLINYQLFY